MAGILLLEDADHRVLEGHARTFSWRDGFEAMDELEAAELSAGCRRAIKDRLAHLLRRDPIVPDRLSNRGRFGLQSAVIAVKERERPLRLQSLGAVEEVLRAADLGS